MMARVSTCILNVQQTIEKYIKNVIQGAHFVIFIYCDILNRKMYIMQNINLYVLL